MSLSYKDDGLEGWFNAFKGAGKELENLKTLFQTDFTLDQAEVWAEEACKVKIRVEALILNAAIWIAATKGK